MAFLRRFWSLLRKPRLDADIEEELDFHLAMRARDHMRAGMSEPDARLAALRRFGNVAIAKERTREMDLLNSIETGLADLRYAARALRKNPSFSVFATLAGCTCCGNAFRKRIKSRSRPAIFWSGRNVPRCSNRSALSPATGSPSAAAASPTCYSDRWLRRRSSRSSECRPRWDEAFWNPKASRAATTKWS
jgi:hypothetical protein